eukprot:1678356-Rhodomonas_salina.2
MAGVLRALIGLWTYEYNCEVTAGMSRHLRICTRTSSRDVWWDEAMAGKVSSTPTTPPPTPQWVLERARDSGETQMHLSGFHSRGPWRYRRQLLKKDAFTTEPLGNQPLTNLPVTSHAST